MKGFRNNVNKQLSLYVKQGFLSKISQLNIKCYDFLFLSLWSHCAWEPKACIIDFLPMRSLIFLSSLESQTFKIATLIPPSPSVSYRLVLITCISPPSVCDLRVLIISYILICSIGLTFCISREESGSQ